MRKQPTADWLGKFNGVLPVAPVLDLAQALDNPFLKTTGMINVVAHPAKPELRVLANPIKIDGAAPQPGGLLAAWRRQRGLCRQRTFRRALRVFMKLEGMRVVDLSVFLPGPYLTMAMADHGAEVIKIEPPGEGDPGRHIGLADGPSTVFFRNLNRGKKSVVLDLKDDAQRDAAARALRDRRRVRRIVPPGRGRAPRRRLRGGARAQSPHRLLLDQRFRPGRRLARPPGARPRARGRERRCSA